MVPCTARHRASICLIGTSELRPGSCAAFLSSSRFSPVKRAEAINSSSWLTLNCSRCRQARQHLSGTPLVGMKVSGDPGLVWPDSLLEDQMFLNC
ncbi:hypothetical protein AV530_000977 [Patagioenas fasciata monilis]|uniref:Uncharacterized protein n=1 Tax=Patagioenas fasciata monilis TaxID=372326 RepID=A0A1V4KUE2_PATFA|nr:hypothetical protein AV530_000977 [Patagioenas fasciata monilis]